jgi:hypothetical protein
MHEHGFYSSKLDENIMLGTDTLSITGWSGLNVNLADPVKKHFEATLDYSPFAAEYLSAKGKSKAPVDDFLRGCLGGGMAYVFKEPRLECIETQCIACGADKCVFEAKPRNEFNFKDGLVRGQLGK